jgi:hypothetical protein
MKIVCARTVVQNSATPVSPVIPNPGFSRVRDLLSAYDRQQMLPQLRCVRNDMLLACMPIDMRL